MKIDFQLPVTTFGVPKGNKNGRYIVATVPVEINILEVRPSDISPVASVSYSPGTPREMTDYVNIDGALFVRLAGMSEFSPSFTLFGRDPISFAFKEVAPSVSRRVDNYIYGDHGIYPAKLVKDRKSNEPFSLSPLADLGLKTFNEDPVALQVASFTKRCERLVVSDGRMLARVAEPVLAVELIHRDGDIRASISPLARSLNGLGVKKCLPHAVFRLDEIDRLVEFCGGAGVARSALDHWIPERAVIHEGFRLSLQTERASLYSAAARLTKRSYGAHWLPNDNQLVDDVFDIVKDHTEDDFPDELGDVLAGIIDLHRSGTKVFFDDLDAEAADHVLHMWDDRKIDVSPVQVPSAAP
jgi:hypothetical protein